MNEREKIEEFADRCAEDGEPDLVALAQYALTDGESCQAWRDCLDIIGMRERRAGETIGSELRRLGVLCVSFSSKEHAPLSSVEYRLPTGWAGPPRPLRLSDVLVAGASSLPIGTAVSHAGLVESERGGVEIRMGLVNVLGTRQPEGKRHVVVFDVFEPMTRAEPGRAAAELGAEGLGDLIDRTLARYLVTTGKRPSEVTALELIAWLKGGSFHAGQVPQ